MWWWWWWWWWEETGGRGKPGIGEEEEEEAFAPLRFPLLPGSSPTLLLLLLDPPNTVQHGLAAAVASLHLSPRSDSVFPLLGFTTFIGLSKNECCMVGRSGGRGGGGLDRGISALVFGLSGAAVAAFAKHARREKRAFIFKSLSSPFRPLSLVRSSQPSPPSPPLLPNPLRSFYLEGLQWPPPPPPPGSALPCLV